MEWYNMVLPKSVIEEYANKKITRTKIVEKFYIELYTVNRILYDNKVPIWDRAPRYKMSDDTKKTIVELYASRKHTRKELCKMYNISLSFIHNIMQDYDVDLWDKRGEHVTKSKSSYEHS